MLTTSKTFRLLARKVIQSKSRAQLYHANHSRVYHWRDVLFMTENSHLINDSTPKSHTFFSDKNLVKVTEKGLHIILPFVLRSIEKLIAVVDREMRSINAHKIVMPAIVSASLWQISGRWTDAGAELFRLKDRHNQEYCLAPTHEEVVTYLLSSHKKLSQSQLPIYLYQITSKYRDELRAKHGFIRGREFIMKDLYTFDKSEEDAIKTYEIVCSAYERLFTKLELPFIKALGSVGTMGGKYSHEYHVISDLGEDDLWICNSCNAAFNSDVVDNKKAKECLSCQSSDLKQKKAIEIGHVFLLGKRYSQSFNTTFMSADRESVCEMGCYGLGVSRILSAAVNVLSTNRITRWPLNIVSFKIALIIPKKGSKEDLGFGTELSYHLAVTAAESLSEDILVDDRTHFSIGRRLLGLKALGIPYIVIAGKRVTDEIPKFEIIDNYNEISYIYTYMQTIEFLEKLREKS